MRIMVPGADFSSKNIGQVEVPITWDVDAAAYRAAIPTHAALFTYTQNRALNIFFKQLKSQGLWSKITNLYLPIFGQSEGGVNLKTPASNIGFPASGATATYDVKGIKFLLGWTTPFTKDLTDVHAGFYNTTARADVDTFCAGLSKSANEFNLGRRVFTGKNAGLLLNAALQRPNLPNHLTSIGPMIGCSKLASNITSVLVDTDYTFVNQSFDPVDPNTSAFVLGGTTAGANTSIQDTSMGLFTFGSYLTDSEMTVYGALQTSLITALLA